MACMRDLWSSSTRRSNPNLVGIYLSERQNKKQNLHTSSGLPKTVIRAFMFNNNAKQKTNNKQIKTNKKQANKQTNKNKQNTSKQIKTNKQNKDNKSKARENEWISQILLAVALWAQKFAPSYLIYDRLHTPWCDQTSPGTWRSNHILTWQNSIWHWKGVIFCLVQLFQTNSESCLINVLTKKMITIAKRI